MIARDEGRMQVCCDSCPASYPNTYAEEDFAVMIQDAKAAGWSIRKAIPDGAPEKDTTDLFGSAPKIAGRKSDPYTHTCPACQEQRRGSGRGRLF